MILEICDKHFVMLIKKALCDADQISPCDADQTSSM